jgi:hypothetical protein
MINQYIAAVHPAISSLFKSPFREMVPSFAAIHFSYTHGNHLLLKPVIGAPIVLTIQHT